jgi:hypothetical protein
MNTPGSDWKPIDTTRSVVTQRVRRRSHAAQLALKGLVFLLSLPIGVIVAVVVRSFLFPHAHGAIPAGAAVVSCYVSFNMLRAAFGVR